MDGYYRIPTSNFLLVCSVIIGILLCLPTLLISSVIPICCYLILENCKYYYNDEQLVVETGVFFKKKKIVPLYRVVKISAEDNIFNFGKIYIKEREQVIILDYVSHPRNEMMKLSEKWEIAKSKNTRNEIL